MAKIYSYEKVDSTANLEGLSFFAKVRAITNNWFEESGRSEQRTARMSEELVRAELTLQADLLEFLEKALTPIKRGRNRSVTLDVSSEFETVLDIVLGSKRIMSAYNVVVISRPKPLLDIKYNIRLRLEAK